MMHAAGRPDQVPGHPRPSGSAHDGLRALIVAWESLGMIGKPIMEAESLRAPQVATVRKS